MSKPLIKLVIIFLVVSLISVGGYAYWYTCVRFHIPENANIKYELDGKLYAEEEVIPDTQPYTMVVTDLDNGRVYRKENVIVYDTKAPVITVDDGERFYIKEHTNLYSGLTITDNYDPEPTITIEGMDVDEHAFYNVLVRVVDKYGNSREEVLECQVLSERYIDAEEKVWKERTFEGYKEFPLRQKPFEPEYTMFEDTNLDAVLEKISNKETFALFLGFNDCPWCQDVRPILQEEASKLNTKIYYIDVKNGECGENTCSLENEDIRNEDNESYQKWLKTTGEEEASVPFLLIYQDGKMTSSYHAPEYSANIKNISDTDADTVRNTYAEILQTIAE